MKDFRQTHSPNNSDNQDVIIAVISQRVGPGLGEKYSCVTIKHFDRNLQSIQYNKQVWAHEYYRIKYSGAGQKRGMGGWLEEKVNS